MALWRSSSGRKAREPRRRLNKPGWISVGGGFAVQHCTIEDISERGAQLSSAEPKAIPKDFILSFSRGERRGKRCRVVWRAGSKLGVKFEE
jgi:PilZ domain